MGSANGGGIMPGGNIGGTPGGIMPGGGIPMGGCINGLGF